ncbi:MAG: Gfo/Idh/MocA family protein [Chloroflexota bacterium]
MNDTPRVGLIGCGQQGHLLTDALRRIPGLTLVACSDPRAEAVSTIADTDVAGFADYRAMIETSRPDAVIVATPHAALATAAAFSASAGCHVFCEKPLALTATEAQPVLAAAKAANVKLMVAYCLRYDSLRRRMKELIADGAVGTIVAATAGKGGPPHPGGWLAQPEAGGGQLLFVGSHLVDQVLWLVGQPVTRVFAEIEWSARNRTDETSVFTLRFADGALAHLDCSQAAHAYYDYVDVMGTHGRVRADWRPSPMLSIHSERRPEFREPTTVRPIEKDTIAMYVAELDEFAGAIREDREPAITGQDGLRVLTVLDAVVASARRGDSVALDG